MWYSDIFIDMDSVTSCYFIKSLYKSKLFVQVIKASFIFLANYSSFISSIHSSTYIRNNRAGMFARITSFIKLTFWLLHKISRFHPWCRQANSNRILCAIWGHMINERVLGFINLSEFLTSYSHRITFHLGNHLYV